MSLANWVGPRRAFWLMVRRDDDAVSPELISRDQRSCVICGQLAGSIIQANRADNSLPLSLWLILDSASKSICSPQTPEVSESATALVG
jgi:hypothetical protein